ncbi:hypothetical protein DPMN_005888 [Dreissena polymorpha]|uniref:Uncharacterized protein n=1 Tax=Dreissena polymorpha TaxID=45954 RepID=A0A9D4MR80_DREPO|nr:hypothetical protein DPMN_005888 [Dreissena polymorpha]
MKFHVQNLTSRVFTRKTAPPPGGHPFSSKNHFQTQLSYLENKLFTRKIAPPTGGHVFQQTGTTFDKVFPFFFLTYFNLNRGIIGTNLLTKFHEERTRNVASRVFTSTVPPTGGHVFQQTRTTFELNQPIIKTNI